MRNLRKGLIIVNYLIHNNYVEMQNKKQTIINYRHKRRKFKMALLVFLYLCHLLSIAHCNEIGKEVVSPDFDLTTAKIREPKDVAPPARLQNLKNVRDDSEDEDDDDEDMEETDSNKSSPNGSYIGSPCDTKCDPHLQHVQCDFHTKTCGCEKDYPVTIDTKKGCAKPIKLGDQCLYHEACEYYDPNSLCLQVKHSAICECADGFHSVSFTKPTKRLFCTKDIDPSSSQLPTLFGVITSIAVLGGLICMVLYLFSKNKYPRARHYADAHLGPPILYASDTGRPSSRSSQRSSGSISSYCNRRASGAQYNGSKGVLVSSSRTGSRRPSLASVHSTSSSVKSYSMKRFEQELQQKELRQEMKKQLTKLQEQQQLQRAKPCIIIGDSIPFTVTRTILPTPSPITPKSTDELLPSVCEEQELSLSLSNQSGSSNASINRPSTSKDLLN